MWDREEGREREREKERGGIGGREKESERETRYGDGGDPGMVVVFVELASVA